MAQGIVDALEVINIHDHQRKRGTAAFTLGNRARQRGLETCPVGQAGQRICLGHFDQPLLCFLTPGFVHVHEHLHQAAAQHHVEKINHAVSRAHIF